MQISDQSTTTQFEALRQVKQKAAIARISDSLFWGENSNFQPRQIGEKLASNNINISQVRSLENIAFTTLKISDILDFLKRQVGRDTRKANWARENIGMQLIKELENLRSPANEVANSLSADASPAVAGDLPRQVHLELCREYIKHLSAEYLIKTISTQKSQRNDETY